MNTPLDYPPDADYRERLRMAEAYAARLQAALSAAQIEASQHSHDANTVRRERDKAMAEADKLAGLLAKVHAEYEQEGCPLYETMAEVAAALAVHADQWKTPSMVLAH